MFHPRPPLLPILVAMVTTSGCGDGCDDEIVPLSKLDTPPPVLQRVTPTYPEAARRESWEGRATVAVVVNADGSVCNVELATSSGRDDVDDIVARAAESWLFGPGIEAGEPVRTVVELTFVFELIE